MEPGWIQLGKERIMADDSPHITMHHMLTNVLMYTYSLGLVARVNGL